MQPITSVSFFAWLARHKYYEYCSSYAHMKVRMPSEKEKWLKFHDGQYQFNVLFMLYADFESILKPLDDQCRWNMNQLNTERKCKTPYREKFSTHIPSGWSLHGTFACFLMQVLYAEKFSRAR